jgi:hypothetical protein
MWSHSQVMWFLAPGYSQLIWSQKPDVIGSCDLCYRAATTRHCIPRVFASGMVHQRVPYAKEKCGEDNQLQTSDEYPATTSRNTSSTEPAASTRGDGCT